MNTLIHIRHPWRGTLNFPPHNLLTTCTESEYDIQCTTLKLDDFT